MPRTMRPTNGATDQPKPRKPSPAKPNGASNVVRDEEVARRAYEIYQSRGGYHGSDLDHWLEAERELKLRPAERGAPMEQKPRKRKMPQAGA